MHVLHDGGIKYASLKSLCKVFFFFAAYSIKNVGFDGEMLKKMLDKVNTFLFVFSLSLYSLQGISRVKQTNHLPSSSHN